MSHNLNSRDGSDRWMIDDQVDAEVTRPWAAGHEKRAHGEEVADEGAPYSLNWRRDFLGRLIADLETRRLRTGHADRDSTEETLQCLRLRLEQMEARLSARFGWNESARS